MEKIALIDITEGQSFYIGTLTLSEDDIIKFAIANDPLDFHINREAAMKSVFKGFVASGSQVFSVLHKTGWIPMFGHSVICGLELNNWKFIKPVYANMPVSGNVIIKTIKKNEEKHHAVITWRYEFKDNKNEFVQTLEVTVLHKI
jgi:acyl dehydratase